MTHQLLAEDAERGGVSDAVYPPYDGQENHWGRNRAQKAQVCSHQRCDNLLPEEYARRIRKQPHQPSAYERCHNRRAQLDPVRKPLPRKREQNDISPARVSPDRDLPHSDQRSPEIILLICGFGVRKRVQHRSRNGQTKLDVSEALSHSERKVRFYTELLQKTQQRFLQLEPEANPRL